ncbi:hypothetical protein [Porphyromonas vaginalis]|uniref:hypothetical protein n=1 Tax=Porphyromonas vaginalis TaxID=3044325 RepID=UPI0026095B67|nr:hypothetical protein [Porphyromonas vaginalis]
MKQKLLHQSLIVTLVTMLLLLAGSSVSAQESYDLVIAGVRVTSANCSYLSAIPGVTGEVRYNPTTKTLFLKDASIAVGKPCGISSYDELTCVVEGKVSISSNGGQAMAFYSNAIIKGNGQLTLKSSEQSGIYTGAALLIESCTVYAEGHFSGITGDDGASLRIRYASVTAKGSYGSIDDLENFTLEGSDILKPAGAVWDYSKNAVCDASGNVIKDEVVIAVSRLEIAGVKVTSANCSDLSVIPGVKGKVSYDPTTKTLTLEDATIDVGDPNGIDASDELTCVVKGEVSITSNNRSAMMLQSNAIIKGNGQLTLKSRESCGIFMEALLIEGCTVYAEGEWGIAGEGGSGGESLTIRNASVTAKGTEASIGSFRNFTLEGCSITKPAGAVWNADKHAVCDASGNFITDEVVIAPVEEYGLKIAGVWVNSANCSDLSVIPGVTGKVSYDPTTKTLTLEDASIDVGEKHLGISPSGELTCVVKGKVSITSNWNAMVFYKNAIIKGNGQLSIKSSERCVIYTEAALLIEGCTVYAEGVFGIAGKDGSSGESLTIRNAFVTAKGRGRGSICDLANFTLEGCEITKPAGAVWNADEHAVCDASGNVITDEVVITPVEEYGLQIAGVKVTSANYSDLTAIPGVKGKVSYDPATKTLYLEDASIDVGGKRQGIRSNDELTCVVKGKVSITSDNWNAMELHKNAVIKGNGQLTIKSSGECGIYTKAALLIEGCTVYAEGKWGIAGYDGSFGESLTIRNASVTAKGSTEGSICDLTNFTLDGCSITKPAGAVWNADEHAVCDASGNVITDEVVITPVPVEEYGLNIAGVEVTSANCSDLTVIPGVKGKVSYDPTTKTLTLEDASIEGIWSKDELTCVVKGKVSITSKNDWSAMEFDKNAIIKGNGQLTLKSKERAGIHLPASLLIEGCTVYAEGNWGIAGESLTIRNASVTAKGTEGSICALANLKLEGCEITKPAGAVWNAEAKAVCDASGNVITDEVVISPKGGTAIDFVTPELQPADGAIYDINGVLRSEPLDELPTGVYIVGGQKVMHVRR